MNTMRRGWTLVEGSKFWPLALGPPPQMPGWTWRVSPPACVCCGSEFSRSADDDQWDGRLDDYCDRCASARCDAFPAECPVVSGEGVGS